MEVSTPLEQGADAPAESTPRGVMAGAVQRKTDPAISVSTDVVPDGSRVQMSASDSFLSGRQWERMLDEASLYEDTGRRKGASPRPLLPLLRRHLLRQGVLTERAALGLIASARDVLRLEPNVVRISARERPVAVIGDTHGQYYDLISLMGFEGLPSLETAAVFLGDYVDRGQFSTEIVLYLCACKLLYPRTVVLLRGNHESRPMCERDGFERECLAKYSKLVFEAFMDLFCSLPLACVIKDMHCGDCLCVHGGIGPSLSVIQEINTVDRYVEVPEDGIMTDLLWADPIPDGSTPAEIKVAEGEDLDRDEDGELQDVPLGENDDCDKDSICPIRPSTSITLTTPAFTPHARFMVNTDRRTSWFYGELAVSEFLHRNQLACIIRGHQVQLPGFKAHWGGTTGASSSRAPPVAPRVITVFSAPRYWDVYPNVGAYIRVSSNKGFVVQQLNAVEHPFVPPNFEDLFSYTIPTIPYTVMMTLRILAELMQDESLSPEERLYDEVLAYKIQKMYERSDKAHAQRKEYMTVSVPENLSKFEQLVLRDKERESRPQKMAPRSRSPRIPRSPVLLAIPIVVTNSSPL